MSNNSGIGDTYFSIDLEADGPWVSPGGFNSIRQIGAVVCNSKGEEISDFTCNLKPLSGNVEDFDTVQNFFKQRNPEAWKNIKTDPQDPADAFSALLMWMLYAQDKNEHVMGPGKPILILWGTAQDYPRLNAYMQHFCRQNFNDFDTVDLKSYAAGKLNMPYSQMGKDGILSAYRPPRNLERFGTAHTALGDARNQAEWFFNIMHSRKIIM